MKKLENPKKGDIIINLDPAHSPHPKSFDIYVVRKVEQLPDDDNEFEKDFYYQIHYDILVSNPLNRKQWQQWHQSHKFKKIIYEFSRIVQSKNLVSYEDNKDEEKIREMTKKAIVRVFNQY